MFFQVTLSRAPSGTSNTDSLRRANLAGLDSIHVKNQMVRKGERAASRTRVPICHAGFISSSRMSGGGRLDPWDGHFSATLPRRLRAQDVTQIIK